MSKTTSNVPTRRKFSKNIAGYTAQMELYKALHKRGLLPGDTVSFKIECHVNEPIRITAEYFATDDIEEAAEDIGKALLGV